LASEGNCLSSKKSETAGGSIWMLIAPLAMVSCVLVPMTVLGEAMQNIAAWLPTGFAIVALENTKAKYLFTQLKDKYEDILKNETR
jgi:ABC-type polysaccharide/polyol phosphate export permease